MKHKAYRIIKIVLISATILVVGSLSAVTAILYFQEERILDAIIKELNKRQVGHTEVGFIDVSPFENFPYISIGIHDLRFYGDKQKSNPAIYQMQDVYVGFDIWDILQGEYTIKKIDIKGGYLHLIFDEVGDLNLIVAKGDGKTQSDSADSELHLDLKAIHISDFRLEENNVQGNKYIDLNLIDVYAEFSSIDDKIDIDFSGDLEMSEYTANEVSYFKNKSFSLDTEFYYYAERDWLDILPGQLIMEYGNLDFEGSIDFKNDFDLNIEVAGRKKNFDLFISFAPDDIVEKLNKFRNEGDIYFKGNISGPSLNANPSFDLVLGCENTFFFHNDHSKAVRDVSFQGRFHTGVDNSLETSELELTNLYGIPESGEIRGTFKIVNFLNPVLSIDFHADLELENFKSFYDPDWLEGAGGNVKIDITINEFVDQDSVIHVASKMEDGTLSRIEMNNAWVKLADYPHRIEGMNGRVEIDGDDLRLRHFSCLVNGSDLLLSTEVRNVASLAHHQTAPIDITVHVESKKLDFAAILPDRIRTDSATWHTEMITNFTADFDLHTEVDELYSYKHFPRAEIKFRKFNGTLQGFEQRINDLRGTIKTSDQRILIDDLTLLVGDNDLHLNLQIDEPGRLMDPEKKGAVHFHTKILADKIDFSEFTHYRGEALLDSLTEAELGDEIIREFIFECDGYVHPSTMSTAGLYSYCNIEAFGVKLNDLPKITHASGRLSTDTLGSVKLESLAFQMGRSDFTADLELRHLLDTMRSHREIYGQIGGNLWDFDEFITPSSPSPSVPANEITQSATHETDFNVFALPFPEMDLTVHVGQIINHRYQLGNFQGHFKASPNHSVYIDTLHFDAADGNIAVKGYLNGTNKDDLYLSGKIVLKDVDLDQVFFKFDNFGQDYLVSEQVHGRVDAVITTKAHLYPDLTPMLDNTEASIQMKVREGRLENFSPMEALSDFIGSKNLNNIRFGEMENNIDFTNGILTIPRMKIASTLGYLHLSGNQNLENKINYNIQVPLNLVGSAGWNMMKGKLLGRNKKNSKEELDQVEEEIISEQSGLIKKYLTFNVAGTTEDFNISMGKGKSALSDHPVN